jgi:hypothetical protein
MRCAKGKNRSDQCIFIVMPKVAASCHLAYSEGEKPKSALYTCTCGGQFEGLKAWREHMVQRSMLRKRTPLSHQSSFAAQPSPGPDRPLGSRAQCRSG